MTYGQTSSGKSHTMGTNCIESESNSNSYNNGIIPNVIENIYNRINMFRQQQTQNFHKISPSQPYSKYMLSAQFIEVYGEEIRDLLTNKNNLKITIRENANGEIILNNVKNITHHTKEDMLEVLSFGLKNRKTASTSMNEHSSRSHGN